MLIVRFSGRGVQIDKSLVHKYRFLGVNLCARQVFPHAVNRRHVPTTSRKSSAGRILKDLRSEHKNIALVTEIKSTQLAKECSELMFLAIELKGRLQTIPEDRRSCSMRLRKIQMQAMQG
jgi:hypothetical protein